MAQKKSATTDIEFARCRCCGTGIKSMFVLCVGCFRKRDKVYKDCVAAGKSEKWSKEKVNEVYPLKYVK